MTPFQRRYWLFSWAELTLLWFCLMLIAGVAWVILAPIEARRHKPCEYLGERPECVSDSHYRRDQ